MCLCGIYIKIISREPLFTPFTPTGTAESNEKDKMGKEGKKGSSTSQGLCSYCEGKATESFKQGCNVTRIQVIIRK